MSDQKTIPTIGPMNDELQWILGRPCFAVVPLAEILRRGGRADIPRKVEHEQAFVIHWMLNLYLQHGETWRDVAEAEIKEIQISLQAAKDDISEGGANV
jgi:hypothetical protein